MCKILWHFFWPHGKWKWLRWVNSMLYGDTSNVVMVTHPMLSWWHIQRCHGDTSNVVMVTHPTLSWWHIQHCHGDTSKCCATSKCCHGDTFKCCHGDIQCCHGDTSKCCHGDTSKCCHGDTSKCHHDHMLSFCAYRMNILASSQPLHVPWIIFYHHYTLVVRQWRDRSCVHGNTPENIKIAGSQLDMSATFEQINNLLEKESHNQPVPANINHWSSC